MKYKKWISLQESEDSGILLTTTKHNHITICMTDGSKRLAINTITVDEAKLLKAYLTEAINIVTIDTDVEEEGGY